MYINLLLEKNRLDLAMDIAHIAKLYNLTSVGFQGAGDNDVIFAGAFYKTDLGEMEDVESVLKGMYPHYSELRDNSYYTIVCAATPNDMKRLKDKLSDNDLDSYKNAMDNLTAKFTDNDNNELNAKEE